MTTAAHLFDESIKHLRTDTPRAYKLLMSAVKADPTLGVAWFNIGCIQAGNKQLHASIASCHRALQGVISDDNRAKCYVSIGHSLYKLGRLDEAIEWTWRAIEANPGDAYPWENLAAVHIQLGETAKAVEYARRGFHLVTPPEPVTQVSFALSLLNNGEYAEGLKHFEARFPYGIKEMMNFPYPRWDGGPTKRLFIVGEQGLGDTLSFCRFVPWAAKRADEVVLSVQSELMRLVAPGLPHNVQMITPTQQGIFPEADCFTPIMSLPVDMGWDDRHIRECPDLDYGITPMPRRGRPFTVGLSWAGATANDRDQWRSIPFAPLMDLTHVPGTQWVCLQADSRAEEMRQHGGDVIFRDVSPFLRDAALTAEFMASEIDLVITIDSFLGHLAGSVGIPAWIMVARHAGDWRLLRNGEKAIDWYPQHRCFRQGLDAMWTPVLAEVKKALEEVVGVPAGV
jgi:Tetratricopeptide repeat